MSRAMEAGAIPNRRRLDVGYFHESEQPFASLIFLLPLIAIYEIGTAYFTTAARHGQEEQIIAFTMLRQFFGLCGVHGQHLPAVAVIVFLLVIHILHKGKWDFHLSTLLGMACESALLALPLLAIARELSRYFPLMGLHSSRSDLIIMSLGAGVYEELVFRLVLFSILSFLLKDALRLGGFWVHLGVVAISALSFSAYHYLSPVEVFQWRSFLFRTAAGAYFGIVFLLRGFGITAACHASYDLIILFI